MRSLDRRLRAVERKVMKPDRLVPLLPDWLADGAVEQPKLLPGERVITPSNYLAYDPEKDEVYFHEG